MIDDIAEIMFVKKSPFNNGEFFQIERYDNKNLLKFVDGRIDSLRKTKTININDNLLLKFLDRLFRITNDWKEKYIQNNTLDAPEWSLVIKFRNENNKEYCGIGSYPNNFDSLEKLVDEIIESTRGNNI